MHVLIHFYGLWAEYQFNFQRLYQGYSGLPNLYATQRPIWNLGSILHHSLFLIAFVVLVLVFYAWAALKGGGHECAQNFTHRFKESLPNTTFPPL